MGANAGYAYRSFCGGCRRRSQSKNKVIATANIAVSVLLGEGRETAIEQQTQMSQAVASVSRVGLK